MSDNACYPDDILSGEYAENNQKQKRLGEIKVWLEAFADYCKTEGDLVVEYASGIAETMNAMYWELLESQIRPRMIKSSDSDETRIDRHKIASGIELVIIQHQPAIISNKEHTRDLNSRLAYFVAMNIIGNWCADVISNLHVSDSFEREHLAWLSSINPYSGETPIFSNAATWYLVELLYSERFKSSSVT